MLPPAGLWLTHSGLSLRFVSGHPFAVLRQVVVDFPPRRLRRSEDVQPGPHARIVLEQARRHTHRREIGRLAGRQRAADPAEGAEAAGSRFVTGDQLLAGEPAELVLLDMSESGEACPGQLAAGRAMAMGHRPHRIDLKTNAATRATALGHRLPPVVVFT